MRRQAEQMLENMSESERRELEQWARAFEQEQGQTSSSDRPFDTELVDARGETTPDQPLSDHEPIAEWYDPDAEYPRDPLIAEGTIDDAPIRDALRSADRAMEDNVIPKRFRNVQRYFERTLELARKAEEAKSEGTPE